MGLHQPLHPRRDATERAPAGQARRLCAELLRGLREPTKAFRAPTDQERAAIEDLAARLRALPAGADAEAIQNEVFEAGKAGGFEPLRAWFQALYEVLLGQSQGPRFGSFVAIFGIERTLELIDKALAGELAKG